MTSSRSKLRASGRRTPEDPFDQLGCGGASRLWLLGERPRAGIPENQWTTGFGRDSRHGPGDGFRKFRASIRRWCGLFSNPATGANEPYVDFLFDAQGEDVVSGRRTPGDALLLAKWLPDIAQNLAVAMQRLEQDFRDVQDIEFTVEDGKLYFLQTRCGEAHTARCTQDRGGFGPRRIDRAGRGSATARRRRSGSRRHCNAAGKLTPLATAVSASPGVASGRIALDSGTAERMTEAGDPVILVRREPSTERCCRV